MGEVIGQEVGVETRTPHVNKWQPTVDAIVTRAKLLQQDEELTWGFPDAKTAERVKANLGLRQHGLNAIVNGTVLHIWKARSGAVSRVEID